MNSTGFFSQEDKLVIELATYYIFFVYPGLFNPKYGFDYSTQRTVMTISERLSSVKNKTQLQTLFHYLEYSFDIIKKITSEEYSIAIISNDRAKKRCKPKLFWKREYKKTIKGQKATLKATYNNLYRTYKSIVCYGFSVEYGLMKLEDTIKYITI